MVVLQDLAIEMNGKQLWPRAHANQMPADVVMGTNRYIWGKKKMVTEADSVLCNHIVTHQHVLNIYYVQQALCIFFFFLRRGQ